eukprot:m.199261 g.199261  ORF g.199261 m.199261 type:complete len:312 (-) comp15313_c0_seq1:25-960(-)
MSRDAAHYAPRLDRRRNDYTYMFKMNIVGEDNVGKTSIMNSINEGWPSHPVSDFIILTKDVKGDRIKLTVWDLPRPVQQHRSFSIAYLRRSLSVVIVYDVTDQNSFHNVGHWLELARHVAASNVVIVLVGNKCDQPRAVPRAQAERYATSQKIAYMETGANDRVSIRELFEKLAISVHHIVNQPSTPAQNKIKEPCRYLVYLLRTVGLGFWSWRTRLYLSESMKQHIATVLLCAARISSNYSTDNHRPKLIYQKLWQTLFGKLSSLQKMTLPRLPTEMWLAIISFVPFERRPTDCVQSPKTAFRWPQPLGT